MKHAARCVNAHVCVCEKGRVKKRKGDENWLLLKDQRRIYSINQQFTNFLTLQLLKTSSPEWFRPEYICDLLLRYEPSRRLRSSMTGLFTVHRLGFNAIKFVTNILFYFIYFESYLNVSFFGQNVDHKLTTLVFFFSCPKLSSFWKSFRQAQRERPKSIYYKQSQGL